MYFQNFNYTISFEKLNYYHYEKCMLCMWDLEWWKWFFNETWWLYNCWFNNFKNYLIFFYNTCINNSTQIIKRFYNILRNQRWNITIQIIGWNTNSKNLNYPKKFKTHRSLFSKNVKNEMDNSETRTRAELVVASSNACAIPLH